MKKLLSILIAGILITSIFVGCGAKTAADFKDGTYRAEFAAADDHGWTDYIEITVESGKITKAVVDSVNSEGDRKSENEAYNQAMKDAGSETWPSEFFPELESQIMDKQDGTAIDGVAGATTSSDATKTLYKALINNMVQGNTETVKVSK